MEEIKEYPDLDYGESKCCRCGGEPNPCPVSCPYSDEINNDQTPPCNCCDSCRHECFMDI